MAKRRRGGKDSEGNVRSTIGSTSIEFITIIPLSKKDKAERERRANGLKNGNA